jgi:CHAD domain-containing protein
MRNYVNEQLGGRLARLAFEVRRAGRSRRPEDVHDLRVSIRRFLECLSAFEDYYPSRVAKKCRRRLREVMELAAAVRDRDIALELVTQAGVGRRSPLVKWLTQSRGEAMTELAGELRRLNRREFSRRWRDTLELATKAPKSGSSPDREAPARFAAHELPPLARKFFKRGRRAAAPDETGRALHEFRLVAKRFRYFLELFRPVYGPGLGVRLKVLQSIQQLLGEVSDCTTTNNLLSKAPAGAVRAAVAAGRAIDALGQRRVRAFRLHWIKTCGTALAEKNWVSYLTRFAGYKLSRSPSVP